MPSRFSAVFYVAFLAARLGPGNIFGSTSRPWRKQSDAMRRELAMFHEVILDIDESPGRLTKRGEPLVASAHVDRAAVYGDSLAADSLYRSRSPGCTTRRHEVPQASSNMQPHLICWHHHISDTSHQISIISHHFQSKGGQIDSNLRSSISTGLFLWHLWPKFASGAGLMLSDGVAAKISRVAECCRCFFLA